MIYNIFKEYGFYGKKIMCLDFVILMVNICMNK